MRKISLKIKQVIGLVVLLFIIATWLQLKLHWF